MSKQWVGQEEKITVDGKTYTMSKPDAPVRHKFTEFAKTRIQDPIEAIAKRLEKMDAKTAKLFVHEALFQSRKSYDFMSDEVQAVLKTEEGLTKMFILMLEKHHPDLDSAEAFKVVVAVHEQEEARMAADGDTFRIDTGADGR